MERAARNSCFGLKHPFKNELSIPWTVRITDEAPYTLTVGGELALTAHVSSNEVVHEWHGEWARWDDLHTSAEVKSLLKKSNALVLRTKEGLKGKGASKGATPSPTSGASLNFQVGKKTANQNQMHAESTGHSTAMHRFHVYTKNSRLHNDERLAEVLAEVFSMQWDTIIFSATRSSHDIVELDAGVQSHVCFEKQVQQLWLF